MSRVVNDEGGFSEATRSRVLEAIADLGYRPNVLARGLITRRTGTIAFIAPVFGDPIFPEVAESMQRAARTAGLTLLLAMNENDRALEADQFDGPAMYVPDGAIVDPATQTPTHLCGPLDRGLPMVVIDAALRQPHAAALDRDLRSGAHLAVDRLVELGRPRRVPHDVAVAGL